MLLLSLENYFTNTNAMNHFSWLLGRTEKHQAKSERNREEKTNKLSKSKKRRKSRAKWSEKKRKNVETKTNHPRLLGKEVSVGRNRKQSEIEWNETFRIERKIKTSKFTQLEEQLEYTNNYNTVQFKSTSSRIIYLNHKCGT